MTVEYRPAAPDEMRQFALAGQIGFGGSTAETAIDHGMTWPVRPEWTLCAFVDGEIAAKMGAIPFVMRWNSRDIACGGVTSVSTLPHHRRRGYLRELLVRAFASMRESGQPVSMLWASMAAIYQRFGYGIGFMAHAYRFDPRHLRFVDELPVHGTVRLLRQDEVPEAVAPIYARFAEPRPLMLHREPYQWRSFVLERFGPDTAPPLVAVYEEGSEALGYVIYHVEQSPAITTGPYERIIVREMAWLTPVAHRGLLRYLAGYDLVYEVYSHRGVPVDDPLFFHAQEPRLLNARVRDGTLVRIVDVPAALEGRGYACDGRLTLAVDDPLCPWNTGAWELTVEGGHARVKRTDAEPDLCVPPRSLASLASGHQPATMLARIGLMPPAPAAALRTADALFRTTHAPLCLDAF